MNFVSRDPSGTLAGALAAQIDANGYAVIEDYVAPDELRGAQAFVVDAIAANGGEYVGFTGTERLGGTFLADLPEDPDFVALCRGIYARAVGKPAPEVGFYQILRCLSGRGARAHSMRFHYDSYVLTALIPIVVPERGSPGRLIILPSTRGLRRTYLGNLVDKVLVDNRLAQALLNVAYRRGSRRMIRLSLKPGNLYFFWGYRSLHTNEPCDADAIRATALLHYADPHADSRVKRALRRR
ncbi:hypothetical protein [Methylobacterium brachiatum]|uniref:hypothetical protein n=1 Tax=Methylobacterium brachiatum TaxID=269660 RepID=UPI0008DF133A|nr:hypothetical protein [Methylobacterium brachiatum]AYO81775.1 hypothetical protein EBB05_05480 [Methylobacterium brachiatum]SFI15327.1 hypothetical protein SAMN02799642_00907 [Methylobacterium brachiatum]